MQLEVAERCDSRTLRNLAATCRAQRWRIGQAPALRRRIELPEVYHQMLEHPCPLTLREQELIYTWAVAWSKLDVLALLSPGQLAWSRDKKWTRIIMLQGPAAIALKLEASRKRYVWRTELLYNCTKGQEQRWSEFDSLDDALAYYPFLLPVLLGQRPDLAAIPCRCYECVVGRFNAHVPGE